MVTMDQTEGSLPLNPLPGISGRHRMPARCYRTLTGGHPSSEMQPESCRRYPMGCLSGEVLAQHKREMAGRNMQVNGDDVQNPPQRIDHKHVDLWIMNQAR